MTDLLATTVGFFPRGDAPDSDAATADSPTIQRDAGLDRVVSGHREWTDSLATPLLAAGGVQAGPARRDDAGVEYRTPVVTGALSFDGVLAAETDALRTVPSERRQAVVPGPYTLATLAADDYYGDSERLLDALASELASSLSSLPPVETVVLLEPALSTAPPGDGPDARASAAIDAVVRATDTEAIVHVPGTAVPEKVYAHLLDAAFDALGVDLVADHEGWNYLVNEYGTTDDVALGVADAREEPVESPSLLANRIEWWLSNTPAADFETVYATTNDRLSTLSWKGLVEKITALGSFRTATQR